MDVVDTMAPVLQVMAMTAAMLILLLVIIGLGVLVVLALGWIRTDLLNVLLIPCPRRWNA